MLGRLSLQPGQSGGSRAISNAFALQQRSKVAQAAGSSQVSQSSEPGSSVVAVAGDVIGQGGRWQSVGAGRQGQPSAGVGPGRRAVAPDGLQAQALQQPVLGNVADGGKVGAAAGSLHGGEIHLGGDVLPADIVQAGRRFAGALR